jgi:hypothetical protein
MMRQEHIGCFVFSVFIFGSAPYYVVSNSISSEILVLSVLGVRIMENGRSSCCSALITYISRLFHECTI